MSNICGVLTNLLPRLEHDLVCIAYGCSVVVVMLPVHFMKHKVCVSGISI